MTVRISDPESEHDSQHGATAFGRVHPKALRDQSADLRGLYCFICPLVFRCAGQNLHCSIPSAFGSS
jgi:hypothetical protein